MKIERCFDTLVNTGERQCGEVFFSEPARKHNHYCMRKFVLLTYEPDEFDTGYVYYVAMDEYVIWCIVRRKQMDNSKLALAECNATVICRNIVYRR